MFYNIYAFEIRKWFKPIFFLPLFNVSFGLNQKRRRRNYAVIIIIAVIMNIFFEREPLIPRTTTQKTPRQKHAQKKSI